MNKPAYYNTTMPTNKMAFVYVILIVISTFSLLYGWVPFLFKQAFVALSAFLMTAAIAPRFYTTRQFFVILIYAIVILLNAWTGDSYTNDKVVMDGLMLGMSAGISYYLMVSDDQKIKKWISISVLVVIIIQTIPSLSIYITSADTIRGFIGLIYQGKSDYQWTDLYKMGILSFDMTHALPVLIPPLMMWLRAKNVSKKWKRFCFVGLVCIILLSWIYDVTTVQLISLFGIGTAFLIHPDQDRLNRQRIAIASIIILPFLLSVTLQDSVLSAVEGVAEGSLKGKIADTRYNLTHETHTGDMVTRQELYSLSINTFLESPIIGKNYEYGLGGHSAVFDRLGAFGLVGFIPFLLVFVFTVNLCRSRMNNTERWYFYICIISFIVLLLVKNMCRLEEWLMFLVVVPSLLTLNREEIS